MEELKYYFKEIKYNNNLQNEISKKILSQFIKNDDIHLEKLLRKLLIIKKRNQQKLLLISFHKWYINIYTPKNEVNEDNQKEENKTKNKIIIRNKSINKDKNNININNNYKDKI